MSERTYKTAIRRTWLSRPVALAISTGVLTEKDEFFDYGCGFGTDIEFLSLAGYSADGWDPHPNFSRSVDKRPSDIVNLSYVLNILESVKKREAALAEAFALTRKVLVVSVRTDCPPRHWAKAGDGYTTRRGTFQKIYSRKELDRFVRNTIGVRPTFVESGIAFVFKDDEKQKRFLEREEGLPRARDISKTLRFGDIFTLSRTLGRLPLAEEFPSAKMVLSIPAIRNQLVAMLNNQGVAL